MIGRGAAVGPHEQMGWFRQLAARLADSVEDLIEDPTPEAVARGRALVLVTNQVTTRTHRQERYNAECEHTDHGAAARGVGPSNETRDTNR